MTGPLRPTNLATLDDAALEAALLDLGRALDVPPGPDVSRAVAARLRSRRRPARPAFRVRWALFAALFALLAIAAIAAGRGFGLPGLRIFFETPAPTTSPPPTSAATATATALASPTALPTPTTTATPIAPPTPTPTPAVSAAAPTLAPLNGERTTLEDARRAVTFPIALPDPGLASAPSLVYLDRDVPGGEVLLVWLVADTAGTADLPVGPDGTGRVAFVMTETRGRIEEGLLGKLLGPDNTITPVDVGRGVTGLWIDGPVHRLYVYDSTGNVRETATRDVGNVLAWVRNGVLYRIETNLDLDRALRIARSVP
jgi:hypothetical protein